MRKIAVILAFLIGVALPPVHYPPAFAAESIKTPAPGAHTHATVAAMVTRTGPDGSIHQTRGYSTDGVGAGTYIYHKTGQSGISTFGFLSIAGTGDSYYQLQIDPGGPNVCQAGAIPGDSAGNGATNDAAFQAAIDALQGTNESDTPQTLNIPAGIFYLTSELIVKYPLNIKGAGVGVTTLRGAIDEYPVLTTLDGYTVSTISDMAIVNPSGSGLRHVSGFKNRDINLWGGRGVEDIAFHNAGSQQLYRANCFATTNGTQFYTSAVVASVGFLDTSYSILGSTVADPSSTGLNGLTLNITGQGGAATPTVGGNTLQDVADAVNSVESTTRIHCYVISAGNKLIFIPGPDDDLGCDCDFDMVFADGTGTWISAGVTAATYTQTNNGSHCTNASTYEHLGAEGMGVAGLLLNAERHSDSVAGSINVLNSVFQSNGADNATIDCDVRGLAARRCHFVNVWTEGGDVANWDLDDFDHCTFDGCLMGVLNADTSDGMKFSQCKISGGTLANTCELPFFSGCYREYATSGDFFFKDRGYGSMWIGGTTQGYGSGDNHVMASNVGTGQILNFNGTFDHWNTGVTSPLGYTTNGSITLARRTDQKVTGAYSCRITGATSATEGMVFSVPTRYLPANGANAGIGGIVVGFWAYRPSLQPGTIVGVTLDSGGSHQQVTTSDTVDYLFPQNTWVWRSYLFNVIDDNDSTTTITICPGTTSSNQLYIDDLVIAIGTVLPSSYAAGTDDLLMSTDTAVTSAADPGTAIPQDVRFVSVTSASADNVIILPEAPVGRIIDGYVGANGVEFYCAGSGNTINGVDCSVTNEAAMPATSFWKATRVSTTGWVLTYTTAGGAAGSTITPDAR